MFIFLFLSAFIALFCLAKHPKTCKWFAASGLALLLNLMAFVIGSGFCWFMLAAFLQFK